MSEQQVDELATTGVEEGTPAALGELGTTEPTAVQPTAETPREVPVNLDDIPEFRNWKSTMDRALEEQKRVARGAESRIVELETHLAEVQLRDASPDQKEAYYRGELDRLRTEQQSQRQRTDVERQVQERATTLLAEMGLTPDAPGLDWSGGATPDGLVTLATSAARLVGQQRQTQAQQSKDNVKQVARAARQEGIEATGAARVSTETGPQHTGLMQEYLVAVKALRDQPNQAYKLTKLRAEYRARGLDQLQR